MCHQPTAGTSAIRRFELPPFIKIPDVALSSDRDRYKSVDRIRFCQAVAGLLQELLQANGLALPIYTLEASEGQDHAKTFEVACAIEAMCVRTTGRGTSRRAAEQAAAEAALEEAEARLTGGP